MNRVKGPVATYLLVDWMPLSKLFHEPEMLSLRALIIALLVALAGCASKERPPEQQPPPVAISPSTWRQIDSDIVAASQDATGESKDYAQDLMQRWRSLVYQHTDADFIPWFSGYWTRKWLTMKVTWYQLNAEGEKDAVVDRLAVYLQEQYQNRVLKPVAKQISPDWIMAQTTQLYVRLLREQLQGIPLRYGVPLDQFDRHIQDIPAIALAPPSSHSASLYQLVNAEPFDSQPAYVALIDRINNTPRLAGIWSTDAGLSSVARVTSESLVTERNTSGAAAIGSLIGRAAGMVISLGTAGFTAMLNQKQRPKMEAQLRDNLHAAFDEEWLDLVHNPETGVLAGVYQISGTIEGAHASSMTQPLRYEEPLPQPGPLPDEPPLQRNEFSDDTTPYQLW
jgi:hypothetical protein